MHMPGHFVRAALLAAVVSLIHGAESRVLGQDYYARRSPIVEAVQKTQNSILTLKVEKKTGLGRSSEAVGTAVIVADQGYAVTNRHVVSHAAKIQATLADGTLLSARVVTEDAERDLAIIKLEANRTFVPLTPGPSCDLMVGETVIAIGNPYGYANSVSRGIISALGREIVLPSGEKLKGLIQTDAPINPGSSGGPLINVNGEFIGVNVAIRDGAQGIAFAIPADAVNEFLSTHLSARKISGVDHGLIVAERVKPEGAARQRVVVQSMDTKSPAARAGLQPGDQIIRVEGKPVSNRFDIERALWDRRPGDQVSLLINRNGQTRQVALPLPAKGQSVASK
jgi:serine protease Do